MKKRYWAVETIGNPYMQSRIYRHEEVFIEEPTNISDLGDSKFMVTADGRSILVAPTAYEEIPEDELPNVPVSNVDIYVLVALFEEELPRNRSHRVLMRLADGYLGELHTGTLLLDYYPQEYELKLTVSYEDMLEFIRQEPTGRVQVGTCKNGEIYLHWARESAYKQKGK